MIRCINKGIRKSPDPGSGFSEEKNTGINPTQNSRLARAGSLFAGDFMRGKVFAG